MAQAGKLKWWQLAVIAVIASFVGGISGGIGDNEERAVYEIEFTQAPWAPPGWIFAPAWTINNFFLLKALQKIVSGNDTRPSKSLLKLKAASWAFFFPLDYVYFKKKSPILAAVSTIADATLVNASIRKAVAKSSMYQNTPTINGSWIPPAIVRSK